MKKKNVTQRRLVALENLRKSEFFPKKIRSGKKLQDRSQETWEANKLAQIEILEKRTRT